MSYRTEREDFIVRMTREGLPIDVTRALLRAATTLQRYAELACSSEAADRDRVPCPAYRHHLNTSRRRGPCLCDGDHQDGPKAIPRITLQEWRTTERLQALIADYNLTICKRENPTDAIQVVEQWRLDFQGDPRGYVLRVIPPSYAERNQGRDRFNLDTIGVPAGPSGLRF